MVPELYRDYYTEVRYFLNSYRALADGRRGIQVLRAMLTDGEFFLSDWKILWTGTIAILRASIDLFRLDARSCIDKSIRIELMHEWKDIRENSEAHSIFWNFLRKERDSIVHEYEWSAYEVWMRTDGSTQPARISLLSVRPEDAEAVLLMRYGPYEGKDSLLLMEEAAQWIEERIYSAICRAGYSPEERRNVRTFEQYDPSSVRHQTLLSLVTLKPDD